MATKQRLDIVMVERELAPSRSQAESWIRLGKVTVDGKTQSKPGFFVAESATVKLHAQEKYVSRAGLKLASVASVLRLNFAAKTVLDIGSSTGGFTDFALQHGAKRVIAVDVGTDQLHPSLRADARIELHEKTDIRDFTLDDEDKPDIIVADVSFISLREILPHVAEVLCRKDTQLAIMVKPQFEAARGQTTKGVVKNNAVRRQILRNFEIWANKLFVVKNKRDSDIAGAKGNQERFYLLTLKKN